MVVDEEDVWRTIALEDELCDADEDLRRAQEIVWCEQEGWVKSGSVIFWRRKGVASSSSASW